MGAAKYYKVIPKGKTKPEAVQFWNIQRGDTVFVKNNPLIVTCEAHYSGDASYDGDLLYADEDGDEKTADSYFPNELNVKRH